MEVNTFIVLFSLAEVCDLSYVLVTHLFLQSTLLAKLRVFMLCYNYVTEACYTLGDFQNLNQFFFFK